MSLDNYKPVSELGLTKEERIALRDKFAMFAITGVASKNSYITESMAENAYALADAMLRQRSK